MKTKGILKFGTSANAYIFDFFNSLDTDTIIKHQKGVRKEATDFDWDWLNENGFDFQLITLHQGSRQNGMYDHEQDMTIWFNFEAYFTFKVLRSPSRKEQSGGFNNNLIFNDLVFKTPNELFAYILEEYFGFEVELVQGYSHKKKSVTITGIK
jgi:hypothetical protein